MLHKRKLFRNSQSPTVAQVPCRYVGPETTLRTVLSVSTHTMVSRSANTPRVGKVDWTEFSIDLFSRHTFRGSALSLLRTDLQVAWMPMEPDCRS